MQHAKQAFRPLHLNDLLALLPWFPTGPVCDIGAGEGHLSAAVAAYGFAVEALDVDDSYIASAESCYGSPVQWIHHDIRGYRMQRESYAAIFCLNVFPFIPNGERARIIGRLKAAVKPGGFLVISGLGEGDFAEQEKWARSSNQISQLPTGVFDDKELYERLHDWEILFSYEGSAELQVLSESTEHQVQQIIARKPLTCAKPDWKQMPYLGAGMSWRQALAEELRQPEAVDFIEVIADHYLEPQQDAALMHLCRDFTVLPHALELSLGSPELRQDGYLEALARVVARCNAPWWSEHLAYTRSENHESLQLNPLPPTEEALEIVKRNIRQVRKLIPVPLLLENIAYYQPFAAADMDDATFLRHVVLEADCGILLDVANLWGNAVNLGLEPEAYVRRLPAERVIQLHIAGGRRHRHLLVDSHDRPVWQEIWDLVAFILKHCAVRAICLERDAAFEMPEQLLREVQRARKLLGVKL